MDGWQNGMRRMIRIIWIDWRCRLRTPRCNTETSITERYSSGILMERASRRSGWWVSSRELQAGCGLLHVEIEPWLGYQCGLRMGWPSPKMVAWVDKAWDVVLLCYLCSACVSDGCTEVRDGTARDSLYDWGSLPPTACMGSGCKPHPGLLLTAEISFAAFLRLHV